MASHCAHHWIVVGPIDGVCYYRCKLCREAKCTDDQGKALELHSAKESGPLSPWWKDLTIKERKLWYESRLNEIFTDVDALGVRDTREKWGMAYSTLYQIINRHRPPDEAGRALASGGEVSLVPTDPVDGNPGFIELLERRIELLQERLAGLQDLQRKAGDDLAYSMKLLKAYAVVLDAEKEMLTSPIGREELANG